MSKKTFRNAAISTMAASAAVAAVAPAVSADSAEDVNFTDIDSGYVHYDNVMNLAGQGIIDGYDDGQFKPYENIYRGQVAKMMTEALDLDIPQNIDKALEKYSDVDSESDYAEYMAATTQADVFQGNDGEFGEYDNITREQMAKVLVKAFNLDEYDNGEDVDLNTDHMTDSHVQYVQTLANLGITKNPDEYAAYHDIHRDQFSSFVIRTQEAIQSIEDVKVTPNDDGSVTVMGTAPDAVSDGAHIILKDSDGEVAVNKMVQAEKDGSFKFTTDKLDDGDYTYTVMAMHGEDGHGEANAETGSVEVNVAPAIEDVSAINTSKIEVDFNKAVEADKITRDDVSVTDAESDAKQIVKSVELADDSKSAEIEFYNALPAEATYNVNVDVDGDTMSDELTVGDLEPATIEADAEQTVQAGQNENVEYTVYDKHGVELTSEDYNADNINFTSAVVNDDGEVTLNNGTSTTTKVQYKDGSNVVAESGDITLTAEASKVDNISNWTVVKENEDFEGFDADDYERNTDAFEGDQLEVALEDQFENDVTGDYDVEYESLDTSVAIVDKNDGQFNKVYESGSVPVKVSVKDSEGDVVKTKTVKVEAKEDPSFASFDFDQDSINISTGNKETVTVEGTVLDQYDNEFDGFDTSNINVESDSDDVTANNVTKNGSTVTFDVSADNASEGSYNVTVSAEDSDGETITEKTIDVKVSESGLFDHYDVSGLEDKLDLNDTKSKDNNTPTEMDISVLPVDENGNATSGEIKPGIKVKDENGDPADSFSVKNGKLVMESGAEEGKYTIKVSTAPGDDSSVIKKHDFEVVDTSEEAKDPEVTFTETSLNDHLTSSNDATDQLSEYLTNIADINNSDKHITDVDFTSNSRNVIKKNDNSIYAAEGNATITINSVTIGEGKNSQDVTINSDNNEVSIEVDPVTASSSKDFNKVEDSAHTINLTDNIKGKDITIDQDDLTIEGNGYTIDGDGSDRAVKLDNADNITFNNVTFDNAKRGVQGDNHGNPDHLTITNSTFNTNIGISSTEDTGFDKIEDNTFATTESGVDLGQGVSVADVSNDGIVAYLLDSNKFETENNVSVTDYRTEDDSNVRYDNNGEKSN